MPGPDPADVRVQRAAERAFVRAHHPDVGGDPAAFAAGLAALRAGRTPAAFAAGLAALRAGRTPAPDPQVTVVATRRLRTAPVRLLRRWRRARRQRARSTRLS